MQKLLSLLVIGGMIGASALPARACGGGGGGCAMAGGSGNGGGRAVAYGKVSGRAPMLAQTTPATRCPQSAPTAVVNKTDSSPTARTVAAKVTTARKAAANGPIYTCPMHPQVQWTKPTDCPICGMKLKLKPTKTDAAKSAPAVPDEHAGMDMDDMTGTGDMQMCPDCMTNMGGMSDMNGKQAPAASQKASRGPVKAMAGMGCGC